MQLRDAQALLDRCFEGMAEGARRLYEPGEPRFAERLSAVWLEYRWYVHERGVAEAFLKWKRVEVERCPAAEVPVVRIHLLGVSAGLEARAGCALEGGTPAPERILDVFGDDGVQRECVAFGNTSVTVERWRHGPGELLEEGRFQALAAPLSHPASTPEERHEAVNRLAAAERSPRVAAALLAMLEERSSLMALRVLSEWGVVEARAPLRRALEAVTPDNPADLWALTALDRRLQAWEALSRR